MSARIARSAVVTCVLLISLPVLLGCGGGFEFDEFQWSMPGLIAFDSSREGARDIYVMKSDGRDVVNLTQSPSSDIAPAFSPDGSQIAFASDRGDPDSSTFDIYIMSSTGGGVTRLTNSSHQDTDPAFSPDGSKIAF